MIQHSLLTIRNTLLGLQEECFSLFWNWVSCALDENADRFQTVECIMSTMQCKYGEENWWQAPVISTEMTIERRVVCMHTDEFLVVKMIFLQKNLFYFVLFMMATIKRWKNISLVEAAKQWASRSFHVGNLTIRDIACVLFGCKPEVFDLNTLRDSAYEPTQIILQRSHQAFSLRHQTTYAVTSTLAAPPRVSDKRIDALLTEAFESTSTVWWFWMHVNQQIFPQHDRQTFSQKIIANKPVIKKVLTIILSKSSDQEIMQIFGRYIDAWKKKFDCTGMQWDTLMYTDAQTWLTKSVHKNDLIDTCLSLLSNRSECWKAQHIDYVATVEACSGPLFSNQITSILSFLMDKSLLQQSGSVYHVWWQAMYDYINAKDFGAQFMHYLSLVDDDNDLSNGLQVEHMEILPAHFFRFLTFSSQNNLILADLMSTQQHIFDLKKKKWSAIQAWNDVTSSYIQELIAQERTHQEKQNALCAAFVWQEEVVMLPKDTARLWVLKQLYQSQLDFLWHQDRWFDAYKERKNFVAQPVEHAEHLVKKIVAKL